MLAACARRCQNLTFRIGLGSIGLLGTGDLTSLPRFVAIWERKIGIRGKSSKRLGQRTKIQPFSKPIFTFHVRLGQVARH